VSAALVLTALTCTLAASAAGGADPAPATPPASAPDLAAPAPPARSTLDFDLLPELRPPGHGDAAAVEARVRDRRGKLQLHQAFGLATWAALAGTVVVGQLDFDDRFRGGGDTGRYHRAHKALAYGSAALFATTGTLALLAPEPYAKRGGRLDTALVHKLAMGTAAAGMVTQIVLGIASRRAAGTLRERNLASAHQVVGYTTLGAMTVGGLVLAF
jgi:hypothetical protein